MPRFLRISEVMNRIPYSRATIYRKIAASKFPKPYDLDGDGSAVAWLESEIDGWIASKVGLGKDHQNAAIHTPQAEALQAV